MYAGRVVCYSLVSQCKYTDGTDRQTDGRTPDRYFTLAAIDAASVNTDETNDNDDDKDVDDNGEDDNDDNDDVGIPHAWLVTSNCPTLS